MKNLKMSELEQCEAAYVALRHYLKELEQKPTQWRTEEYNATIRQVKKLIREVKAEIKSFQLPLL